MPDRIAIHATETDGHRIVEVSGEIDLASARVLDDHLEFDETCRTIVLDLSGVTFIDSTGLRSIVRAQVEADDFGGVLNVVTSEKVDRLLEITGLHSRLNLFVDRDSAVQDG